MRSINQQNPLFLYVSATFCSLLLSFFVTRHYVINLDGICYLQSAMMMPVDFSSAMHLCMQSMWPFYSMLIIGFSKLTGSTLIFSASFLNSIFTLISVLTFISIVRVLARNSGNITRLGWLAAIVILLAHQFNSVRDEVIRDHGFWAFYLLSFFFLLRYFNENKFYLAFLFSGMILIASLFRVEGIVFLFALPFVAWFNNRLTWSSRFFSFLKLNILNGFLILSVLAWSWLYPHQPLGRLPDVEFRLLHSAGSMLQHFRTASDALAKYVLNTFAESDAPYVLSIMLIGWYFLSVIWNVSYIYAILIIYAWWKRLTQFTFAAKLTLWSYILINIAITTIFLITSLFIVKRYLMALSLVLMLWVPFALDDLIQQWPKRKWPIIFASLFIVFSAIGGIFSWGYSKYYIRQAGEWMNQTIPQHTTIYSNNLQLMYYSEHFGNQIFSKEAEFQNQNITTINQYHYDYLAIKLGPTERDLVNHFYIPIKVFPSVRGDRVIIYKKKLSEGDSL